MSEYIAESSAIISASATAVYAVLSDYRVGHQAILPRQYFKEMIVHEGGQGAGTVIEVNMEVFGVKQTYHMTVSEPEPGRVLQEADPDVGVTTTFTVDPIQNGEQCQVTISTRSKTRPGIKGLLEKLMNPPITRHVFTAELKLIEAYVQQKQLAV